MNPSELKDFLDEKVLQYNTLDFIESDPVQIPHLFSQKEDIEIAGFLSATIAWGNRKMIIKNSHRMMDLMGNAPYDFVMSHTENDLEQLELFVHRTFNGQDFASFIRSLQHVYANHGGLEVVFSKHQETHSMQKSIHEFKKIFFEIPHPHRTQKHISDPLNNSAAKRINMYLRWMIRQDNKGVDLGIWKSISPASLSCPLDVHSGNVARKLGLLTRKQNDGKALSELDTNLRKLDGIDPVKYDFALFGLGVFEGF
ncbi:TIGR02757 family protein [Flavobacterium sp. GSP27]|uniref:TIGR02757 family protein n=2 Tax=Flavobacterium TaxID=237 RepID=A0A432CMP2_9FLAO|nr:MULTISPECIES: TIGR02757 family protein [Flavobacterium]RTY94717.1 TIGR02757 family protein [Flavobacterium sp. GSN2]RTY67622.1 TIGR02757 family protein [Flavobacterium sp. LB2P53]RTY81512.1 TIGR02757 family protein [Flavobacterium sp. ZB4P23]RTZ04893.1 TIGR02757 family protein [Flavobacterium bomense]RTZ09946.1 TIGR02757 family protein [Flavobacterium sp. GSP27]